MNRKLLKNLLKTCVITALSTLMLNSAQAQVDGDMRSKSNNAGYGSAGTWQIYTAAANTWTTSTIIPTATTNVTLRDGFTHTTNGTGYVAGTLTIGEGSAFRATAVLTGGVLTGITIVDPGKLNTTSSVLTILGSSTTLATAAISSYKLTGTVFSDQGAGYTTAAVQVGNVWTPSLAYALNAQVNNGGKLYTCKTAGTSDVANGPTGTGTGIADGTVVWDYAGVAATVTPNIVGGKITSLTITNAGTGYLSLPGCTITGDGTTPALYAIQVGIAGLTITNGGAGYTDVPSIIFGTIFQVGNSSTNRSVSVSGDVSFKSGANIVSGGGAGSAQTLIIGGNLSAVTPISFRSTFSSTAVPAVITLGNTNVTFSKAGTATLSGARMIFNNVTINAGTTVNITNDVVILGTLTNNGTLTGTYATTLPITLSSLAAKADLNNVKVSWATSSEINNDKFVVERSTDGKAFSKIGEVKAQGPSSYSVIDNNPANGVNYYRLVQYDLNGKSEVFGPVAVNFNLKSNSLLVLYPNPTQESISFHADGLAGAIQATLLDMSGKIVFKENFVNNGDANYTLNLGQKPQAGQYLLQVNSNNFNQTKAIIVR